MSKAYSRSTPEARKEEILTCAVERAKLVGLNGLRRDDIATQAGVSQGLVTRYFNTMNQLRTAVVRYAVHHEILPLVAEALVAKDPQALKAPQELKDRAFASV